MAHLVEEMVYVGDTPWHGLGQRVNKISSIEEGLSLSGLNWTVRKDAIFKVRNGNFCVIPDRMAVVREDTGDVLEVVSKYFTPLQNVTAFQWFNPFLEEGSLEFETAGCLQKGRKVWILAKLKNAETEIIKGDPASGYLLLANSHDGSLGVRVQFTMTRVVCNNTLHQAVAKAENGIESFRSIRHMKNVKEELLKIREIVDIQKQEFKQRTDIFRAYSQMPITASELTNFFMAALSPVNKELSKKQASRLLEAYESSPGQDIPGVRGTYWGAYNALTYFIDHKGQEDRKGYSWFGDGARIRHRANSFISGGILQ
jgi:phage/plasmid-like protein (TIGR03299 family)